MDTCFFASQQSSPYFYWFITLIFLWEILYLFYSQVMWNPGKVIWILSAMILAVPNSTRDGVHRFVYCRFGLECDVGDKRFLMIFLSAWVKPFLNFSKHDSVTVLVHLIQSELNFCLVTEWWRVHVKYQPHNIVSSPFPSWFSFSHGAESKCSVPVRLIKEPMNRSRRHEN